MNSYNQSTMGASSCLFRFKKLRDRHHKTVSSNTITSTGHAIHEFAARYHRHCWKAGVQTDISVWRGIADAVLVGSGLRNEDKDDFLALAEGFVNSEIIPAPEKNVALEKTIHTRDERFFGTPDRVVLIDNETVAIDDWKSWRRIPPESECRRHIQLPYYAMILQDNMPDLKTFNLRFLFLRYGRETTWTLDRFDVGKFREQMVAAADTLDGITDFPARGGADCVWCEFTGQCPLVKEGEIEIIRDMKEAEKQAGRLCALQAKVKALTGKLKDFVETGGPVAVEGAILNFHPRLTVEFDVPTVGRAFKKAGVALEKVLAEASINAAAIKRVGKSAKMDKESVSEILATGEEKVGTTFRFKRAEDDGEDE